MKGMQVLGRRRWTLHCAATQRGVAGAAIAAAAAIATAPAIALVVGPIGVGSMSTLIPQVGPSGTPSALTLSPDGKWLAVVCQAGIVDLWDVRQGIRVRSAALDAVQVAFSRDGRILAVASKWGAQFRRPGVVTLFSIDTWRALRSMPVHDAPIGIALSPNGAIVAALGGSVLRLWNTSTGTRIHSCTVHVTANNGAVVVFSPDGSAVAVDSADLGNTGEMEIWDTAAGDPRGTVDIGCSVHSAAFSPDGRTIAVGAVDMFGHGPRVELWDVARDERRLVPWR
jgi:WD40 repeat protein